jgi:UDP-N-acetylglucosamine 3-dehydrogenase
MELSKKLKTAVIGAGNIGFHHCRNYFQSELCEFIGVYDSDSNQLKKVKEAFNCYLFSNLDELIQQKPDAVSICVPTHLHYQVAKKCLENGIHCLVEKPLSTDLNEIDELIDLAAKKNLVLTVGQIERFNPAVKQLKEIIETGILGEIVNIVAKRVGGYPPSLSETGVYFDLAVHDLDIILYLLNEEPEKVTTHKLSIFNSKVDDASSVFIQFKRASAFIQVNWITPVKIRTLSVTGTKGYAELNFIDQKIELFERNADPENFEEKDFHEFLYKFSNPQKKLIQPNKQEPLKNELEHFIKVINKEEELVVKPEQVLQTMKWLMKS